MYYYLHGLITMHSKDSIVVECSGVGYEVVVSHPEDFPISETMFVFTCLYTHEDEQYLVGFKTIEEKELYIQLITVAGIGPKTAISILSASSVYRLKAAINRGEVSYLTSLPGIGRKNASQIILDLKGKLSDEDLSVSSGEKNLDLAYDGLKGLGFKAAEIKAAFNEIEERNLSVEEYITKALRILNKR